MRGRLGDMVDRLIRPRPQMRHLQPMQHDRPADPEHGRRAHCGQHRHQFRHRHHQPAPKGPRGGGLAVGRHMQPNVVHLHDQGHRPIDRRRDEHPHHRERDALHPETGAFHGGQGNGHDLRRQDEIGLDRARHLFLFQMRGVFGVEILGHLGIGMWEQKMKHLLRPLKAQIGPAQHQQRRDRGG